jgi:3-hydroxyisobutyrate dehydrogenase
MCRETVVCGTIGQAMLMKLAVNLYLHTMTVGLTEAVHFADRQGLDLNKFREALAAGPMASDVTRVKLPKLIERDFSVQAAITDALQSCQHIASAAREAGVASPLLDLSRELYAGSISSGNDRGDMISVIHAIEASTIHIRGENR